MTDGRDYLVPPRRDFVDSDHVVPLSPPSRPPFAHYTSHSTLPATPRTPYPGVDATTPRRSSDPRQEHGGLPPYLSLPYRLLLALMTPAVIPLILTIAHLISNRSSTSSLAASLRASVLAACSGLAKGAASLQTLPRYLAMQTNDEVVRATQASILFLGLALIHCVTIIEKVVGFIVDTYRSLLLCTIELAVRGTLEIVIEAVKTISDGITRSLDSIRTSIQNDLRGANDMIQAATSSVNTVAKTFGYSVSIPEITIPSLNALQNVTVPTGFQDSLVKLNASIPSLQALKDKMTEIIEIPFEALKKEMNATRLEMAAEFNSSLLPVPSLASLSANEAASMEKELCSGLDTSLIDDTANALNRLSNAAIGLMFLLLFLVWAALMFWEWRRWKAMRDTVDAVEAEWAREGPTDAWRVVSIVEHPVLERYGAPIIRRVTRSNRTRTNIRWYLSYLSHPTCLALLFIASLGFLSLQFQLVALDAIKSHARENANSTVTASSNQLTAKLNAMAMNSSRQYATTFNAAIAKYQDRIDNELFGSWLNTTAVVLNNTIVEFYDGIENGASWLQHVAIYQVPVLVITALNTTFGGTVLYGPINTFMYCILGSKIDNLEQGLTWISQNAKIKLPTLPADILMLSNASMNELATPVAAAAVGSGSDSSDTGAVGGLIEHFERALRVERNFYGILLGVWLAFALIGLVIVIWHSGGQQKYAQWRGIRGGPNSGPASTGVTAGRTAPFTSFWSFGKTPIADQYADSGKQFRGMVPADPPPQIRRPSEDQQRQGSTGTATSESFFDYAGLSNPSHRPQLSRQTTLRQSIASLVGPGQAFLRLGLGRQTPAPQDDSSRLVDRGVSSEKYNEKTYDRREDASEAETPPPFWVKRFYGGGGGLRSLFPSRGQKLGAQLDRNASVKSERSFGASQPASARQLEYDWRVDRGAAEHLRDSDPCDDRNSENDRQDQAVWDMVDPRRDQGRYPSMTVGSRSYAHKSPSGADARHLTQPWASASSGSKGPSSSYPRPMSRAPTLPEGAHLAPLDPCEDAPPLPPSKHDFSHRWEPDTPRGVRASAPGEGDDYDYDLYERYDQSTPHALPDSPRRGAMGGSEHDSYADMDRSRAPAGRQISRGHALSSATSSSPSPVSWSVASYPLSEVGEIGTAHTASRATHGPGTAALAAVFADMRQKQRPDDPTGKQRWDPSRPETAYDPFETVFDDPSERRRA